MLWSSWRNELSRRQRGDDVIQHCLVLSGEHRRMKRLSVLSRRRATGVVGARFHGLLVRYEWRWVAMQCVGVASRLNCALVAAAKMYVVSTWASYGVYACTRTNWVESSDAFVTWGIMWELVLLIKNRSRATSKGVLNDPYYDLFIRSDGTLDHISAYACEGTLRVDMPVE